MKMWCYYLIETRELYAISPCKEIAKQFEKQRCMSVFIKKILRLDNYEFSAMMASNRSIVLVDVPLFDGPSCISMALTVREDSLITYEMERIEDEINAIKTRWKLDDEIPTELKRIVLQYLDLYQSVDIYANNVDEMLVSNINSFRICYMLFRNTFEEGGQSIEFKPGEESLIDVN